MVEVKSPLSSNVAAFAESFLAPTSLQAAVSDLSKIRAKFWKIQAQIFRHLCSHCVMNETDY